MREQDIKVGGRYLYKGSKVFKILSINYGGRIPTCSLWYENENRRGRTAYPLHQFKKNWCVYEVCKPKKVIFKHKMI
jgi:hypothetical protein